MTVARRQSASSVDREARFVLFRSVLLDDAVAATRAHRRQEIHRGSPACRSAATLCGDCLTDVLLCIREVQHLYDRATVTGRETSLGAALRPLVEAAEQGLPRPALAVGLLRSLLSNAGKSARRKLAAGDGRTARPERALQQGAAFAPLRTSPELLDVLLRVLRFAGSNTRLPDSVLPYERLAEELDRPAGEVRQLVDRGLALARECDAAWVAHHVDGPLSERLAESGIQDGDVVERLPVREPAATEEVALDEAAEVIQLARRRHLRGQAARPALLGAVSHLFGRVTAADVARSMHLEVIVGAVHGDLRGTCCS